MKKLIVANWKELPETLAQAEDILARVDEWLGGLAERNELSLVFCPPFNYLEHVARMVKTGHLEHMAELGAQDVQSFSPDLGVRYVIVGHSDRRYKLGESDAVVNEKLKTVLHNGLVPIVCVGERIRDGAWQDALKAQVEATFFGLSAEDVARCIIAYEPVWAISTNPHAKPDTPSSAVESMALIQQTLNSKFKIRNSKFLYGGSVTPSNADDFLQWPEISGILVGGASVRSEDFCQILSIAAQLQ